MEGYGSCSLTCAVHGERGGALLATRRQRARQLAVHRRGAHGHPRQAHGALKGAAVPFDDGEVVAVLLLRDYELGAVGRHRQLEQLLIVTFDALLVDVMQKAFGLRYG